MSAITAFLKDDGKLSGQYQKGDWSKQNAKLSKPWSIKIFKSYDAFQQALSDQNTQNSIITRNELGYNPHSYCNEDRNWE